MFPDLLQPCSLPLWHGPVEAVRRRPRGTDSAREMANLAGWHLDAGDRNQRYPLNSYPQAMRHGAGPHRSAATRAGHLYLGSGRPIWNNDRDAAILIDPTASPSAATATEPPGFHPIFEQFNHGACEFAAVAVGRRREGSQAPAGVPQILLLPDQLGLDLEADRLDSRNPMSGSRGSG